MWKCSYESPSKHPYSRVLVIHQAALFTSQFFDKDFGAGLPRIWESLGVSSRVFLLGEAGDLGKTWYIAETGCVWGINFTLQNCPGYG